MRTFGEESLNLQVFSKPRESVFTNAARDVPSSWRGDERDSLIFVENRSNAQASSVPNLSHSAHALLTDVDSLDAFMPPELLMDVDSRSIADTPRHGGATSPKMSFSEEALPAIFTPRGSRVSDAALPKHSISLKKKFSKSDPPTRPSQNLDPSFLRTTASLKVREDRNLPHAKSTTPKQMPMKSMREPSMLPRTGPYKRRRTAPELPRLEKMRTSLVEEFWQTHKQKTWDNAKNTLVDWRTSQPLEFDKFRRWFDLFYHLANWRTERPLQFSAFWREMKPIETAEYPRANTDLRNLCKDAICHDDEQSRGQAMILVLLAYREFQTSEWMLATLVNGYDRSSHFQRENIINVLEFWLETFPADFHNNAVYEQVKKFVEEKLNKRKQDLLDLLLDEDEGAVSSGGEMTFENVDPEVEMRNAPPAQSAPLPKRMHTDPPPHTSGNIDTPTRKRQHQSLWVRPNVSQPAKRRLMTTLRLATVSDELDIRSKEIARAMHIVTCNSFSKLRITEFLRWGQINSRSPNGANVQDICDMFTRTAYWVKYTILSANDMEKRVRIMRRMIAIAYELCFNLRNYNGAMAVVVTLSGHPIGRLKHHWKHLRKTGRSFLLQYERMRKLFSETRQYLLLRNYQRAFPGVPWVGLIKQDVDRAYALHGKATNEGGLELKRYEKLAESLNEVKCVQERIMDYMMDVDVDDEQMRLDRYFRKSIQSGDDLRKAIKGARRQDAEAGGTKKWVTSYHRAVFTSILVVCDNFLNLYVLFDLLLWNESKIWTVILVFILLSRIFTIRIIYDTNYNYQERHTTRLNLYQDEFLKEPGDGATFRGKLCKIIQALVGVRIFFSGLRVRSGTQLEEALFTSAERSLTSSWYFEFCKLHNVQVMCEAFPFIFIKAYFVLLYGLDANELLVASVVLSFLNTFQRCRRIVKNTKRSLFTYSQNETCLVCFVSILLLSDWIYRSAFIVAILDLYRNGDYMFVYISGGICIAMEIIYVSIECIYADYDLSLSNFMEFDLFSFLFRIVSLQVSMFSHFIAHGNGREPRFWVWEHVLRLVLGLVFSGLGLVFEQFPHVEKRPLIIAAMGANALAMMYYLWVSHLLEKEMQSVTDSIWTSRNTSIEMTATPNASNSDARSSQLGEDFFELPTPSSPRSVDTHQVTTFENFDTMEAVASNVSTKSDMNRRSTDITNYSFGDTWNLEEQPSPLERNGSKVQFDQVAMFKNISSDRILVQI